MATLTFNPPDGSLLGQGRHLAAGRRARIALHLWKWEQHIAGHQRNLSVKFGGTASSERTIGQVPVNTTRSL
jgi:hypothetical protein